MRKEGKMLSGKDSPGFDTHTPTMKELAYGLLLLVPTPLWLRKDGKLLKG